MNDFLSVPVILKSLPTRIHGFVTLGEDYEPIIIINSNLPRNQQCLAYRHEMNHLKSGEFYDHDYYEYK